jgi:hypothetical protein
MAEPKRIDEDKTTPPNAAEWRPSSCDTDTRRQLLHNGLVRSAESEPVLSSQSSDVGHRASRDELENRDAATHPAAQVRNNVEIAVAQPISLFADC